MNIQIVIMDFKVILIILIFAGFSKCDISKIRPQTSEEVQQSAAFDVIKRLVGNWSDLIRVNVDFRLPLNYFKV